MGNHVKTIGVVHGGVSHERQKSLEYGKNISKILESLGMNVLEMHLHPNGSWTVNGKVENVEESLKKVDKVWNCLVENLCEKCRVKLVGHSVLHSHLSSDKKNLHHLLAQHNIKTPYGKTILKQNYSRDSVKEIFTTVGVPAIVKPLKGSGAWGVMVVNNFSELLNAVELLIEKNLDVLVEKLIVGTPVSCFVFEHNNLLNTNIKVHDDVELGRDELMQIRNEALYIHNVLAYPHHVEYDFIISKKPKLTTLYFLEANTHPSLSHGYIKNVFSNGVIGLKEYVKNKVFV
jgi:D-alanine-D-alanine ligase-like ATP-grasp enzyme